MLTLMSSQSPSVHTKVRLSFEEVWTCKKPVCHHSQQQISKAGPSFVPAKFVALKHYPLKDPWLQNLVLDWIHPHQKHMFKRRCFTYPTALKIFSRSDVLFASPCWQLDSTLPPPKPFKCGNRLDKELIALDCTIVLSRINWTVGAQPAL